VTADELPSWRETTTKQSIAEFVAAVTHRDSPDFVPERDRVAVFDNDGTLWTERPVYAQLLFALDPAAELGHPTSLEELHTEHKWTVIDMAADWATTHPRPPSPGRRSPVQGVVIPGGEW
jgi:hypothetical protein